MCFAKANAGTALDQSTQAFHCVYNYPRKSGDHFQNCTEDELKQEITRLHEDKNKYEMAAKVVNCKL